MFFIWYKQPYYFKAGETASKPYRGPKKKKGHFGGKRKPRESYDDIVKENELFEKYYKASIC
jgi:hypothetical protein